MTEVKRVVYPKSGDIDVLRIETSPLKAPKAGEVSVQVVASGINFADILARQGLYQDAPPFPCTVGYEVSGTVTAVGEGVDETMIGQRVYGLTQFGGYTSHINIPVAQVFPIPGDLSFEEAASIPVAYLTAYALVVAMGGLTSDETILIHNAGGGVGLAALDIAKHIGAKTVGTASKGKHEFLKARGLDHAVDYNAKGWEKQCAELTDNRGFELIIDPLGGGSWRTSMKLLRATGRLGMFGISEAAENGFMGKIKLLKTAIQMPFFHPVPLMNKNQSVFGVNMGRLWHEVNKLRTWVDVLNDGIDAGWVRPHVDSVFSFEDAGKAHKHIENRKNIGKVLLKP